MHTSHVRAVVLRYIAFDESIDEASAAKRRQVHSQVQRQTLQRDTLLLLGHQHMLLRFEDLNARGQQIVQQVGEQFYELLDANLPRRMIVKL